MTEIKAGVEIELKSGAGNEGKIKAIFSRFNVIDKDNDVTLPGAFEKGQKVPIAGVGHNWDTPVIGYGVINSDSEKAWIDGFFNLKMMSGKEHYESIKFSHENGVKQDYSYAFDVKKKSQELLPQWPGAKRVLAQLDPKEISPVLLGAGIDTGTWDVKTGRKYMNEGGALGSSWPTGENDLCPICGVPISAHGPGIAEVHKELFGSVLKAREGSDLKDVVESLSLKYADQGAEVLAHLEAFTSRSKSLADIRAKEGRALSSPNRERITQMVAAMRAAAEGLDGLLKETDSSKAPEGGMRVPVHNGSLIKARLATMRYQLEENTPRN